MVMNSHPVHAQLLRLGVFPNNVVLRLYISSPSNQSYAVQASQFPKSIQTSASVAKFCRGFVWYYVCGEGNLLPVLHPNLSVLSIVPLCLYGIYLYEQGMFGILVNTFDRRTLKLLQESQIGRKS